MLNKIILFSLNNKLLVVLMIMALIIAGILGFKELPIDAVPDITNNQVQIITNAPSFAAQDIERKITFPIEQNCSNIAGIKEIRSFSRFGLSLITIVFDDNVDIYWARQQISERLQKIQNDIPADIGKPELAPITTGLGEIYQYTIRPKPGYETKYSLSDLRDIQDWIVRRQLLGIKGVADVSSFGGKLKQYEIAINPYQLNAYRISLSDVLSALENNNQNTGSAFIEKNSTAYFIRSEGLISDIKDIENIVIKTSEENIPIQIKDVASVKLSHAVRYGAMVYTSEYGKQQYETTGGIVMMLKGENSNKVIERVKEKINDIQKTLPEGIIIDPFLDRTKMVHSTIKTVFKNLFEGILIVIIVLVFLLGNLQYGLLVASVIPLSMMFTIIMMNSFRVSGNLMSLGALDFGLIVDGAVIITESVLYQVIRLSSKNKLSSKISDQLVLESSSKMMNAAVFGQIIILVVYLPVLYFTGIEGKMFRPMAQTVIFALAGAFLLSLTYIPVMSSWLARSSKLSHFHISDKFVNYLEKLYTKMFKIFFRRANYYISFMIILFFISIYILIHLGGEFIPTLEEGDFAVETRLMTGSGLNTTINYCKKLSKTLTQNFPDETEKIVCKIGSGEIPTDPMPIESADMMVILKPMNQWKKAHNFDELAQQMQNAIKNVLGVQTSFQYPVQMRFNELIAGAKQDVVIKLFGENIDSLSKYVHILSEIVSKIEGTEGIYEEPIYGQPQIVIQFNRQKLAQYNVDILSANMAVKSIQSGINAGILYENERRYDIVIRTDSTFRAIDDIKNILVKSQNNQMIPLNMIADVIIKTDVNQIQRESAKRRIILGFNVRGRDVESVINEIKSKIKTLNLPSGYYIKYGGSFENLESAKKRLMITVPVALMLVFLMLYLSFHSVKLSTLIFSTIPMSVIGGILLLYFRSMTFSISAGVGFIVLFGIAVLNGVVLISEFNNLKQIHSIPQKIILQGIKRRFRPIITTALVAALGFFPMYMNTGIGANVQKPLATVVIGGLISSTILTMFILPCIYYRFELSSKRKNYFKIMALITIGSLLFIHPISAQSIVNYTMCIDSAIKNNWQIKSKQILEDYQKEITKTAWNIDKTSFQLQYGQYNGIYNDNAIQIQQNFSNPGVYVHQKQMFEKEWNLSQLQTELEKRNIKITVSKLFYDIVIVSEKIKQFQYMDTIYNQSLNIIELRYRSGDMSALEKNIINNLIYQNYLTLTELQLEKQKMIILLQLLTKIKPIKDIDYSDASINTSITNVLDTNTLSSHISLQISHKNIELQQKKLQIEQSKILPDYSIAYTNQTLKGWGTDNEFYPISKRFQYFNFAIHIPVFTSSFIHKIKAEKELIKYNLYQQQWQNETIHAEYEKLIKEYWIYQNIINKYKTQILSESDKIISQSYLNFKSGNISLNEWINYTQQSFQTKLNYLNYIQLQNQNIIQLEYLLK